MSSAPEAPRARLRILVVDDEPILRTLLAHMLRRDDVVVAEDGLRALEILDREGNFDVILTDICMPGIDGLALHARIAERHPALADRVVFCSGDPDHPELAALLETAPNAMVAKPYHGATVEAAILATVGATRSPRRG